MEYKPHQAACYRKSSTGDLELVLELSCDFSEFLFNYGLWEKINAEWGTIFDQFEEDQASVVMLNVILEKLKAVERLLTEQDHIRFIRAWKESGEPIEVALKKADILNELDTFRGILRKAIEENTPLELSL